MIQPFQRLSGDLELCKCVSSSTRIRASKDYWHKFFCALWGNTYFRTVKWPCGIPLLPGIFSVYVCTITRAGTSFQEKTLVTATTLRQFAVGHEMYTLHKKYPCPRIQRQGAKWCSVHSFAWLTKRRGEQHHGDAERQGQPRLGGKHTFSLQSAITYLWELCGRAKLEELSPKCQQSLRDTDLRHGEEWNNDIFLKIQSDCQAKIPY